MVTKEMIINFSVWSRDEKEYISLKNVLCRSNSYVLSIDKGPNPQAICIRNSRERYTFQCLGINLKQHVTKQNCGLHHKIGLLLRL